MSRTLFLKHEKRVKDEGGRQTPQKLPEKGKEIVNRARGVSRGIVRYSHNEPCAKTQWAEPGLGLTLSPVPRSRGAS